MQYAIYLTVCGKYAHNSGNYAKPRGLFCQRRRPANWWAAGLFGFHSASNRNPLHLIEAHLVAPAIVELRGAGRGMVRHRGNMACAPRRQRSRGPSAAASRSPHDGRDGRALPALEHVAITAACSDSARPALAGLRASSGPLEGGAAARRGAGLDWPLAAGGPRRRRPRHPGRRRSPRGRAR
jgi:hypothetical protein